TKEDAENALAARLLKLDPEPKPKAPGLTLAQASERYLAAKARKRSLAKDRRYLEHFKSVLGADTALVDITASRISAYKAQRLAAEHRHEPGRHPPGGPGAPGCEGDEVRQASRGADAPSRLQRPGGPARATRRPSVEARRCPEGVRERRGGGPAGRLPLPRLPP